MTRRVLRHLALAVVAGSGLLGCGGSGGSSTPSAAAPVVVTFEVDDERFKALLTDPTDIDIATHLLAGDDVPNIPSGKVIHETGVNTGYTWSMDPDDIEFVNVTDEACDGVPSDVETGQVAGDRFCPTSAVVVAIEPAP
jgi:hypothetical protein